MPVRPDLAPLLSAARSEAKRWGAQGPNLLLLAVVVARRYDEEFRSAFGQGGLAAVEQRLSTGGSPDDEASVVGLLERASTGGGVQALVRDLRQALDVTDAAAPPAATETRASEEDTAADDDVLALGERVAHLARRVDPDAQVLGREGVVDDLLAVVGRATPGLALLVGPPGSGRSSVAGALARRLAEPGYEGPLWGGHVVVAPAGPLVEDGRSRALGWVLDAVQDRTDVVLVLDDVEVLAGMTGPTADLSVLALLRSAADRAAVRMVLTTTPEAAGRLGVHDADLAARTYRVPLPTLSGAVVRDVAARAARELGQAHRVQVPDDVVALSTVPPHDADTWVQPGLALRRLDAGCVHARLRGSTTVATVDLRVVGDGPVGLVSSAELADRLRRRVIGQDPAIATVSRRLTLTRAGLDLRPERPDGAFLFVGPTGVGKTELAKALSAELFGDEQRLIRLDMSEYAHDWAVSRLIGPMPGIVGSTEPESWLTTRVRQQPETVVLLDEIEKAHPTVWNTFLQVFDAGRLSDSRGKVTDFSRTVIVMTSNLGARSFSAAPVGFDSSTSQTDVAEGRVLDAVKAAMAPELVNRLDAVVVFHPLPAASLFDIAAKEVGQLLDRLATLGYRLTVEDDVVEHLARTGYDAAYGARHLQRNIERLLLQPLADQPERSLTAVLDDAEVRWVATS